MYVYPAQVGKAWGPFTLTKRPGSQWDETGRFYLATYDGGANFSLMHHVRDGSGNAKSLDASLSCPGEGPGRN